MDRGTRFVIAVTSFDEKQMLANKKLMDSVKVFEYALLQKDECPFFTAAASEVFILYFQMVRRMTQHTFLCNLSCLNYYYYFDDDDAKSGSQEEGTLRILFLARKGPNFSAAVSAIRKKPTHTKCFKKLQQPSFGKALFFGAADNKVYLIFSCHHDAVQTNLDKMLLVHPPFLGFVEFAETFDNYNEELLLLHSDCENTRRVLLATKKIGGNNNETTTYVAILSSTIRLPIALLRRRFEECFIVSPHDEEKKKDDASLLADSQNFMVVGRRWPIALKHNTFWCCDRLADLWIMSQIIK